MIEEAFEALNDINKKLDANILELSVKQSQIVFTFHDELLISMKDLLTLNTLDEDIYVTDVTCFQNRLYVSLRDVDLAEVYSSFKPFISVITTLRELVCACPALEYVISTEYIKVFLDVPNIKVSDLNKLIDVFHQDPFVEFAGDRPYLLFINEDMYTTEEMA